MGPLREELLRPRAKVSKTKRRLRQQRRGRHGRSAQRWSPAKMRRALPPIRNEAEEVARIVEIIQQENSPQESIECFANATCMGGGTASLLTLCRFARLGATSMPISRTLAAACRELA